MSLRTQLKILVTDRVAASRGPINRLRAEHFGLSRLLGKKPELVLYYEAGDPHSHLCAQWLRHHHTRLTCPLRIRVVPAAAPETYPEEASQRAMAMLDAARIAPAYGLNWPQAAQRPDEQQRKNAARQLVAVEQDLHSWLTLEKQIAAQLFAGASVEDPCDTQCDSAIQANHQHRARLGHYLPAMWQYRGDWFWALDRMDYLQAALRSDNALADEDPLLTVDTARYALPKPPGEVDVEVFFSFRSPYSYLSVAQLRDEYRDWPHALRIRPVLPMAMRGMKIPQAKGFYIVRDVYREAQRLGIAFGHIADPIGAGAQRCLQVFPLAIDTAQQLEFCYQAARAIWSEAIDVATDEGLKLVCERSGIDWNAARRNLLDTATLDYAEDNRKALLAAGAWGVPTFRLGEFVCWGNDRLPMLRQLLGKPNAAKVAQTG